MQLTPSERMDGSWAIIRRGATILKGGTNVRNATDDNIEGVNRWR